MNEFGKRLKLLREEREISQEKLAEALHTTKGTLSKYENGKMDPTLDQVLAIANFFNVTLDWMAGNGTADARIDSYRKTIQKLVDEDISPETLGKMIEVMKGLKQ